VSKGVTVLTPLASSVARFRKKADRPTENQGCSSNSSGEPFLVSLSHGEAYHLDLTP